MKVFCVVCDEEFDPRRAELGYRTCTDCGEKLAQQELGKKFQRTAPLLNKGSYQYITDGDSLKSLNRKV